ncbi:MAG: HAMP domain-containing histidine kinase [Ruminococcus sp.]|uniref:sensor histidine kinase n=1 Tax=Ruminococcus sp. TaxID=41978 RepID=UPI001B06091C|nr:HAMP domain-containing sensor histidine kinase [Ruminococcus sp.]MBO7472863.1 HAMP domain-containing histidine kinase [Ruminococcus sp.]
MIKRLRKRFILICTLSFLAVFVIMVTAIYVTNTIRQNRRLDFIADIISENGSFPKQKDTSLSFSNSLPDFINNDTPFTTRFYTVSLDENGLYQSSSTEFVSDISETDAEHSAEEVLKKGKSRGWYGDFRYKVYEKDGNKQIIFISGKNHRFSSNEFMKSTIRIFGIGSLAVLALIIILSKYAMRPTAESYQKQKQFVTDASHELKTPLTLILTNIDIAESELGQNEWLDDIRSEGERMSKLVNRLVTLSRMDEEKALGSFNEFDLSGTVSDTVSEFTELASIYGKNLTADIDKGIKYHGDESEIRQLTAILLDNAVKYCDEGGSIKAVLSQKKYPILTVTNSYKKVDNIKLDRLFDRFYREDTARTAGSGFGIGLSIAQSITEHHKGSIKAVKADEGVIGFIVKL